MAQPSQRAAVASAVARAAVSATTVAVVGRNREEEQTSRIESGRGSSRG